MCMPYGYYILVYKLIREMPLENCTTNEEPIDAMLIH